MSKDIITKADLVQFTGSTRWFRHGLVPSILYTEGAQFLAENAAAYWLLDEIAFAQAVAAVILYRDPENPFNIWRGSGRRRNGCGRLLKKVTCSRISKCPRDAKSLTVRRTGFSLCHSHRPYRKQPDNANCFPERCKKIS